MVFSDLCSGNYDIDITLVEDENEICGIELESKILTTPYKADYSLSFSPGSEPLLRNAFFGLNNPIPGEDIMFNLYSVSDQEELCFGLLSEMFTSKSCFDLKSAYEYCAIFTRPNGCQFRKCFIVPGTGQTCENELNISLVSNTDECKDLADGSLEVSVEINECTEYNIAWTSGDIGLVADNLKAGNYCVTAISKDCENCRTVKCFDVESTNNCDDNRPCEAIIASEVLIATDFIFYNTSTNNCEGGSFEFDASGSSVFPVTVSVASQSNDGCIPTLSIELTQSNSSRSFEVNCFGFDSKNCAGKYCFNVERPGCPVYQVCRNINFCRGKFRDSKELGCLKGGDGGSTGNPRKEISEEVSPIAGGNLLELYTGKIVPQENNTGLALTKVYPNPFTTDISIQLESTDEQTVQVELTDIYGRTVIREVQQLTKGINLIELQPSNNLASGIYALIITDQHQKKYTQLITRMNN